MCSGEVPAHSSHTELCQAPKAARSWAAYLCTLLTRADSPGLKLAAAAEVLLQHTGSVLSPAVLGCSFQLKSFTQENVLSQAAWGNVHPLEALGVLPRALSSAWLPLHCFAS